MTTIQLDDRRKEIAQMIPKLQHLFGGVPLLITGLQNLQAGDERLLALFEVGLAVMLLATFIKDLRAAFRHKKHEPGHTHSGFGWFDLVAGGMLIFEAFHSPHHKAAYLRPQFLSGVITIGFGALHGRLHAFHQRRRYLKLDENGLEFRFSRFRHLRLSWKELASVEIRDTIAVFHRTNGRKHTVRLALIRNADDIRQGLLDHAGAAGVPAGPEATL